jgi:TPR repeat protein
MQFTCPLSAGNYDTLKGAIAGRSNDQFLLGLNLLSGEGAPYDRKAGLAWIAKSAEAGFPLAADWVERKLQSGEEIEVDETKVAIALKKRVDSGDVFAMRVLAPMVIRGRGTAQDQKAGIALLLKAAEQSKGGEIEYQIAELYLVGTNGLSSDHDEAMKWYAIAAGRGNISAMSTLGGLWENVPLNDLVAAMRAGTPDRVFKPDIVQSYCWRMRAALMGSTVAQYELALMLTRRSTDTRGNVIEPDLVQADMWFRLGARDAAYNNSQVRAAIEPKLTTAELEQAKKLVAGWKPLDLAQLKATPISVPGREGRTCPPMT